MCVEDKKSCGTTDKAKKPCEQATAALCAKQLKKGCHWANADGSEDCFVQGPLVKEADYKGKIAGTVKSCGKARTHHDTIEIEDFEFDGEGDAKFSLGALKHKKVGEHLKHWNNEEFITKKNKVIIWMKTLKGEKVDTYKEFAIIGTKDNKRFAAVALKKPTPKNLASEMVCICSKATCPEATKTKCAAAKSEDLCKKAVEKAGCSWKNANGSVQFQVLAIMLALL
jgi:hypothetical protein